MPQSLDFVKTRLSSFYSRARIGKKWNGQAKTVQFSWSLIDIECNPVDLIYRWHLCLSQELVFHSVSSDLSIINPRDSAWFSHARWVFFSIRSSWLLRSRLLLTLQKVIRQRQENHVWHFYQMYQMLQNHRTGPEEEKQRRKKTQMRCHSMSRMPRRRRYQNLQMFHSTCQRRGMTSTL